jgi:hypothetical protein
MHLKLCPITTDGTTLVDGLTPGYSLLDWAMCEAHRHKWVASLHAQCDLGPMAWREWRKKMWPEFLGHRRYEHLQGLRNWPDFPADLFGAALSLPPSPQLDLVMARIKWGAENLDLLAPGSCDFVELFSTRHLDHIRRHGLDIREVLVQILLVLRVNDLRPEFPEHPEVPASGCYCLGR